MQVRETGLVASLSGLLSFALFFGLRLLLLRIVDRTVGAREAQAARFEAALDNMSGGLSMFDAERKLLVFNKRYLELFGIPAGKIVLGMSEAELQALATDTNSSSDSDIVGEWTTFKEHGLLYRANGNVIEGFRKPMVNGGEVVTYEDITQRSLVEEKLFHLSRHDSLTGLPNRRLFHEELEYALGHAGADGAIAVLYLDIDHFKRVNDTLGHPTGDKLLKKVALRLRSFVQEADAVARVGGDEFAIVQTRVAQPLNATALASRLLALVSKPFVIDGERIEIGATIGIALSPGDGNKSDQLLKNADLALHRAKAEERGTHRYFEPEMDARVRKRHALEKELRRAIAMEQFELFYQPIVNIASEEIVGFEALLRWNHPLGGIVRRAASSPPPRKPD